MNILNKEIVASGNLKLLADDEIKKLNLKMKTLEKKLETKCLEVKLPGDNEQTCVENR